MSEAPDPIYEAFTAWLAKCGADQLPWDQRGSLEAAFFLGVAIAREHDHHACTLSTLAHIRRRHKEDRQ